MSKTELAWAAGFFDGEGCTTVNKCFPKKTAKDQTRIGKGLRMSVAQVEMEPLKRFYDAIRIGAIRGPYKYSTNKQPHFQWNCSNVDVIRVLDLLWPYLCTVKQRQALKNVDEYCVYLETSPPRKNQYDKSYKQ